MFFWSLSKKVKQEVMKNANLQIAFSFTPGLLATDDHIQIQIILPRELSEPLWM